MVFSRRWQSVGLIHGFSRVLDSLSFVTKLFNCLVPERIEGYAPCRHSGIQPRANRSLASLVFDST